MTITNSPSEALHNAIAETRTLLALLADTIEADTSKSDAERSGVWLLQNNVGTRLQEAYEAFLDSIGESKK